MNSAYPYLCILLYSEQNQTDRVRLVRLSSVIELAKNFNLDCVRLPNQWQTDGKVGIRLNAADFSFGLVRLTGSRLLMIFLDFLPGELINLVIVVVAVFTLVFFPI